MPALPPKRIEGGVDLWEWHVRHETQRGRTPPVWCPRLESSQESSLEALDVLYNTDNYKNGFKIKMGSKWIQNKNGFKIKNKMDSETHYLYGAFAGLASLGQVPIVARRTHGVHPTPVVLVP